MTASLARIQKKGNLCKYGSIAALGGSVVSFVMLSGFFMWLLGLGLLGTSGYLFVKMMKFYAESGKRL